MGKKNNNDDVQTRRKRLAERRQRAQINKEDSKWKSEFKLLSEQLSLLGLVIFDVPGDGNCMFRALADQLFDDQTRHSEVRQKIMQFIESHAEDFQPFVEDDEPFVDYLNYMKREGSWGGQLELQAACRQYNINIIIYQYDAPAWEIINFDNPHTKTVFLSYHRGQHYASVHTADPNHHLPIPATIGSNNPKKSAEDKNIELILRSTTIKDMKLIKSTLKDMNNDVDATIETLIAITNSQLSTDDIPISEDADFPSEYLDYEDIEMQQIALCLEDSLEISSSVPENSGNTRQNKKQTEGSSQKKKTPHNYVKENPKKKTQQKKADIIREQNLKAKNPNATLPPPPNPKNPSSSCPPKQAKAIRL